MSGLGTGDRGCNIPEGKEGLEGLLKKELVTKLELVGRFDHSFYKLTQMGQRCVYPCLRAYHPQKLLNFKREGISLDDFTTAEFVLHLGSQGWRDVLCSKFKKREPFTLTNNNKIWYRVDGVQLNRMYLHALAVAEARIKAGKISGLHHGQPQAY